MFPVYVSIPFVGSKTLFLMVTKIKTEIGGSRRTEFRMSLCNLTSKPSSTLLILSWRSSRFARRQWSLKDRLILAKHGNSFFATISVLRNFNQFQASLPILCLRLCWNIPGHSWGSTKETHWCHLYTCLLWRCSINWRRGELISCLVGIKITDYKSSVLIIFRCFINYIRFPNRRCLFRVDFKHSFSKPRLVTIEGMVVNEIASSVVFSWSTRSFLLT